MKDDILRVRQTDRYADYVLFNRTVFLVEVPKTDTADMAQQTKEVLASIESQLEEAGSRKSRILMATIYLPSFDDLSVFNELWAAWLPKNSAPARACVQAALVNPSYRLEIALTAALL